MSNLMDTIEQLDIHITSAKGVYLNTNKGKSLYDLFNDVGVVGLGHSALQSVFEKIVSGTPYSIPSALGSYWREKAASKICDVMGYDKVCFANSGTEAIDTAIKLARRYMRVIKKDERDIIYTLEGSFHGRTYGALTASDAAPYHKEGFGPFLPGFKHFKWIGQIDWNECLAVMITPAFVNKDFVAFNPGWLNNLQHEALRAGSLFIVDEIQTGFGRCGEWKLTDKYNIQPDIVIAGKGIANGLPVGAVLANNEIAQAFTPGRHFSTYGGLPLCMMAVCEVIRLVGPMIRSKKVHHKGKHFMDRLNGLEFVNEVRGIGLLIAMDLIEEIDVQMFCQKVREHGVMIAAIGSNCIKLTPPLIISYEQIDEVVDIFNHVYCEHTIV